MQKINECIVSINAKYAMGTAVRCTCGEKKGQTGTISGSSEQNGTVSYSVDLPIKRTSSSPFSFFRVVTIPECELEPV